MYVWLGVPGHIGHVNWSSSLVECIVYVILYGTKPDACSNEN